MKLVVMMYLEEDTEAVHKLLAREGVEVFSEAAVRGHGRGAAGWYGDVAPYPSGMLMAFLPAEPAEALMEAIRGCEGCQDSDHPIRGWMMDVEKSAASGPRVP
ncbi:MAG: hypothetical protein EA352_08570 [Gemmatimonadales bacterium]|nr:MAG: hypothetical protein EA352_08570 [Gemmatimonadales bacterium]